MFFILVLFGIFWCIITRHCESAVYVVYRMNDTKLASFWGSWTTLGSIPGSVFFQDCSRRTEEYGRVAPGESRGEPRSYQ